MTSTAEHVQLVLFAVAFGGLLLIVFYCAITVTLRNRRDNRGERQLFQNEEEFQAIAELKRLAQIGEPKFQFKLAILYKNGRGVPKDHTKAAHWLQKAADQDFVKAQFILGLMYYQGQGVNQNRKNAVSLWTKAAEQGYEPAQEALHEVTRPSIIAKVAEKAHMEARVAARVTGLHRLRSRWQEEREAIISESRKVENSRDQRE